MTNRFDHLMKELMEEAKQYEPSMSLYIDEDSKSVELIVDPTVSHYGDWIKGEGADICLLRCHETNKVVGVHLPLYNNKLSVFHKGEIRINDGFKKETMTKTNPTVELLNKLLNADKFATRYLLDDAIGVEEDDLKEVNVFVRQDDQGEILLSACC
jgi:hypothetical protein